MRRNSAGLSRIDSGRAPAKVTSTQLRLLKSLLESVEPLVGEARPLEGATTVTVSVSARLVTPLVSRKVPATIVRV